MPANKNFLTPYQTISAGDMSTATLTSSVTDIRYLDNVSVMAVWTGSPVGVIALQGSLDKTTWATFATAANEPAGSGGSNLFDLNQLSFPYLRTLYTKTSGTGSLTVTVSGKSV